MVRGSTLRSPDVVIKSIHEVFEKGFALRILQEFAFTWMASAAKMVACGRCSGLVLQGRAVCPQCKTCAYGDPFLTVQVLMGKFVRLREYVKALKDDVGERAAEKGAAPVSLPTIEVSSEIPYGDWRRP